MTDPLVSVVITAYQAASWLPATLASVMAQTYRHWEVVLIDDGSTDDTVERIAALRSRIRYFHQPNTGMAAQRATPVSRFATAIFIASWMLTTCGNPTSWRRKFAWRSESRCSGLIVCDGVVFHDATEPSYGAPRSQTTR